MIAEPTIPAACIRADVEVKRVIDPLESFHLQLEEEVEACEHEQTFPRKRIYTDSRYTL